MGLFGRDDRTTQSKPAPPAPSGRQHSGAAPSKPGVTLIARSNHVEGSVLGSGDIHIDGRLEGQIDSSGHLLIADGGFVEGSIKARTIVVSGAVKGDIAATETIELKASSTVEGNISAPRITITEGATFDGQVAMKQPGAKPGFKTSSARKKPPAEKQEAEEKSTQKNTEDKDKQGD